VIDPKHPPIAREGFPFIALFAAGAVVGWFVWCPLGILFAALTLFALYFFRDPDRQVPDRDDIVLCPADGRIVRIVQLERGLHLDQPVQLVSIFMNVFNVHVNRMPLACTVKAHHYHPGKFVNAALDKASTENERSSLILESEAGDKIEMVQVAGLIARRIVNKADAGSRWQMGSRYGLIRFGSRVDLYLPPDWAVNVTLGEKTTAGQTIIASIPKQS